MSLVIQEDGITATELGVFREPGDPWNPSKSSGLVTVNLTRSVAAWAQYMPTGQPGNGRPRGQTPLGLV